MKKEMEFEGEGEMAPPDLRGEQNQQQQHHMNWERDAD